MGFNLVNLVITVRTADAAHFRSCLPLLGKEYAAACRSLSCHWPERVCETCSRHEGCAWYLVFGQKLSSDPSALKRHQKPPLPFAFTFPEVEPLSGMHRDFECGLVVIGQAISQLNMLLKGFAELLSGRSFPVPAEIIRIESRDYQGSVPCAAEDQRNVRPGDLVPANLVPANLVIASTEGLLESRSWIGSNLHLRLLSPLRMLEDGVVASRFEFSRFARSVMRRVSSMAYYYGENEFDCDFKELSRLVKDVVCTDYHFSTADAKNRKLTGIIGSGTFSGEFSLLMPFLVIGSYIHTGKGSSFGMGAYELIPDDGNNHS